MNEYIMSCSYCGKNEKSDFDCWFTTCDCCGKTMCDTCDDECGCENCGSCFCYVCFNKITKTHCVSENLITPSVNTCPICDGKHITEKDMSDWIEKNKNNKEFKHIFCCEKTSVFYDDSIDLTEETPEDVKNDILRCVFSDKEIKI